MKISTLINKLKLAFSNSTQLTHSEASIFVSVCFAATFASKTNRGCIDGISQFRTLYNRYEKTLERIGGNELLLIKDAIFQYCQSINSYSNEVSWIYQGLKGDLERIAFNKALKEGVKLDGLEGLAATQFFTDSYMVDHLVKNIIDWSGSDITKTCFVDPACGGGNFLTKAFDYLFNWYSKNTNYTRKEIVERIIKHNIIGYDLDSTLGEIAALSLYIHASQYETPDARINIFGGVENDKYGYLASEVISTKKSQSTFQSKLKWAKKESRIIYVTNPPFMGRRDMNIDLKEYISAIYPNAKGDLCISFLSKLLSEIRNSDRIGIVSQNSWLHLKSYKDFRYSFLKKYHLIQCVDLGSKAFERINGEKANVVLLIIGAKNGVYPPTCEFINLKDTTYPDKVNAIENKAYNGIQINCDTFLQNATYEFNYALSSPAKQLYTSSKYGVFASCMQGTSTGNNKDFVKFIWELPNSTDWRLVSKGGGFSKWIGLNYHIVKWGENGSLIKGNKGSALRNIEHIPYSDIVYSDTGTLGLNARIRLNDQVFIASGPGIRIKNGNALCHLGFLNSRFASLWIKNTCPKLTISAGYIEGIPTSPEILCSDTISAHVQKCLESKRNIIEHKLPNFEYYYTLPTNEDWEDFITRSIKSEFKNWRVIYDSEMAIEHEIIKSLKIDTLTFPALNHAIGNDLNTKIDDSVTPHMIDELICKYTDCNCFTISKKLKGLPIGSSNILEIIAYEVNISPRTLYSYIEENCTLFSKTIEKYRLDIIHKIILNLMGINDIKQKPVDNKISLKQLCDILKKEYSNLLCKQTINIERLVLDIIIKHHSKSFYNRPLLSCLGNKIITL